MLPQSELFDLLEAKYELYNNLSFIETDPVSIPHLFSKKEDIEISGFLAATIAWGQRTTIIRNARQLMEGMDNCPHEFIINASAGELERFAHFKHRTFNGIDLLYFMEALKHIYTVHGSIGAVFGQYMKEEQNIGNAISQFRKLFFSLPHPARTRKHIADPSENSSAKRINMFLRWMVRKDNRGVDFGIWEHVSASRLLCPLDVHSGNVARKLGLLHRKQNDWKAVEELTAQLRCFDALDPVKYDFALFGLGVFERF